MNQTVIIIADDNIIDIGINIFYKENAEIYDEKTYNYNITRYLLFCSTYNIIETFEKYVNINNINSKYIITDNCKKILKDETENILLNSKIVLEKYFKNFPDIIICVSKKNLSKCKIFSKIIFSNYHINFISE
jgi:hypothetical protein